MTYIYLFEAPDYVYCGQHRCADNKDPMTDDYKGSGTYWKNYLKENDWWNIKNFRKNVKKTILEIVMDDTNRTCIGNVEKYWIDWTRETYGDKCINVSKGSRPNTKYNTIEEAEEVSRSYRLVKDRKYYHDHIEEKRAYDRKRSKTEHRILWKKDYNEAYKPIHNVNRWGNKYSWPAPENVSFPIKWTDEQKKYYEEQYHKKMETI